MGSPAAHFDGSSPAAGHGGKQSGSAAWAGTLSPRSPHTGATTPALGLSPAAIALGSAGRTGSTSSPSHRGTPRA